jgi:hypothetical protein
MIDYIIDEIRDSFQRKIYNKIHENSTLGEDVGTEYEYRR